MGDYNRTTRECSFTELQPEMVAAIRKHIEGHKLGDVEPGILGCWETANELKPLGFFTSVLGRLTGRFPHGALHRTGAVVTPKMLIVAPYSDKRSATVLHSRLTDIEVRDYEFKHMITDTGLSIFGFIGDSRQRGWAFIGLGTEPAAQRFESVLRETVEKAKDPG